MRKTYFNNSTILTVFDFNGDEKFILGKILTGIVFSDQTYRFVAGQRVITSKITSHADREFMTKSGNCYVLEDDPTYFDLSFSEFIVMRHFVLSPDEILEARNKVERKTEHKLH